MHGRHATHAEHSSLAGSAASTGAHGRHALHCTSHSPWSPHAASGAHAPQPSLSSKHTCAARGGGHAKHTPRVQSPHVFCLSSTTREIHSRKGLHLPLLFVRKNAFTPASIEAVQSRTGSWSPTRRSAPNERAPSNQITAPFGGQAFFVALPERQHGWWVPLYPPTTNQPQLTIAHLAARVIVIRSVVLVALAHQHRAHVRSARGGDGQHRVVRRTARSGLLPRLTLLQLTARCTCGRLHLRNHPSGAS